LRAESGSFLLHEDKRIKDGDYSIYDCEKKEEFCHTIKKENLSIIFSHYIRWVYIYDNFYKLNQDSKINDSLELLATIFLVS